MKSPRSFEKMSVLLAMGAIVLWELYSLLPSRLPYQPHPLRKRGAIHIHSVYSDGGGTIEEIAEAAHKADLDFVVITDHNNTEARREGKEKNYNGVDVYIEVEASTFVGHALTFHSHTDAAKEPGERFKALSSEHFMGNEKYPEMFLIVAHPHNAKIPWTMGDRYAAGIELANFDSIWRREAIQHPVRAFLSAQIFAWNPYLATLRTLDHLPKNFEIWDAMNAFTEGHVGILAPDAHSKIPLTESLALHWPRYETLFRIGSNTIYLSEPPASDFAQRKRQIYEAIQNAQLAFSYDIIHPFSDFDWYLECGDKKYYPGSRPAYRPGCRWVFVSPETLPGVLSYRIFRNGVLETTVLEPYATYSLENPLPGMVRVEAWIRLRTRFGVLLDRQIPYAVYNPIFVQPPGGASSE